MEYLTKKRINKMAVDVLDSVINNPEITPDEKILAARATIIMIDGILKKRKKAKQQR